MSARQIVFVSRLAAWTALVPYAVAVLLLALLEASDDARGLGLGALLTLYFSYVALYVVLVTVLARPSSLLPRFLAAAIGAICVAASAGAALMIGFTIGAALLLPAGMLGLGLSGPLIAIPAVGAGVGEIITLILRGTTGWPRTTKPPAQTRFAHIGAGAVAASLAFYFGVQFANGAGYPFGVEYIVRILLAGLAGPLALVALLSLPLPADEQAAGPAPLDPLGRRGWAIVMLVAAIVLVIEAGVIDRRSGGRLWTAQGMASVLARQDEVMERRKPPADEPLRITNFVVDQRPADLQESFYDWRTGHFLNATFKLGTVGPPERPTEVRAVLTASGERGLGYLCDAPVEGKLTPCVVAGREGGRNADEASDPRIIRVGLYQGAAQIGRHGRTFMISCRYSAGFCKIEFTEPWFEGIRVAVLYTPQDIGRWVDVVPFAVARLDALIRPAP